MISFLTRLAFLATVLFSGNALADPGTTPAPATTPPAEGSGQNDPATPPKRGAGLITRLRREVSGGGDGGNGGGDDLLQKAARDRESHEQRAIETRQLELAIGFNMGVDDFVSKNASLLPSEVQQIVKISHKERYDNATSKASALKAAIIQSYFSVQENLDFLTTSQKAAYLDYSKLTKNGKEDKAAELYENIFEPALESMRKVKKSQELHDYGSRVNVSSDSDIIFKKTHEKQMRALSTSYKLNDVLYEQAKSLGLAKQ